MNRDSRVGRSIGWLVLAGTVITAGWVLMFRAVETGLERKESGGLRDAVMKEAPAGAAAGDRMAGKSGRTIPFAAAEETAALEAIKERVKRERAGSRAAPPMDEPLQPGIHFTVGSGAGGPAVMELALDELWVSPAEGKAGVRSIPQADGLDELCAQAEAVRRDEGAQVKLILYPRGAGRGERTRRLLSGRWRLDFARPPAAETLARLAELGAGQPAQPDYGGGFWLAEVSGDPGAALRGLEAARALPGVRSVEPLLAQARQKKLIPNDPLFAQQWHLRNTGQSSGTAGADANVTGVWDAFQGSGVVIGVIDDGVELLHPDLAPNATPSWHYDWNGNDSNPAPSQANEDFHGTAVAGVAAARGGNGLGVSGAAPLAQIVGLRLIAEPPDDLEEAAAFAHQNENIHIKNNSWGPPDTGDMLGEMGPLAKSALANAAANGRGGKGTILLWAGGNGRDVQDQSNKDGYANNIHVIAVGAATNKNTQAPYSEDGSNLVVCAPSDGGSAEVVTTDMQGNNGYNAPGAMGELSDRNYTKTFGGTSAATPVAAGVAALMLEANPNLGWRDVKEILLRSSRKIQPASAGWTSRYGGRPDLPPIKHHESFGGGVADAAKAVELAESWTNLPAATQTLSLDATPDAAIPDFGNAVEQEFDFSALDSLRVEHVEVTVDIPHQYRGDLEIQLVSPTGVVSLLAATTAFDNGWNPATNKPGLGYQPWTFSSVRHWGEGSRGVWKLRVRDRLRGDTGTWESATVKLHGIPSEPAELATYTERVFASEGESVTLSAAATGDPMIHFEWSIDGKFAAEVLDGDWIRPAIKLADAGAYRVTAINATGAETSPVIPLHVVRVETAPVSVVVNKTLTLKANAAGPGLLQYRWQRDGVDLIEGVDGSGTNKAQLVVKNITPAQAGEFECLVSDGVEEKSAGARLVTVLQPPVMDDQTLDPTIVSGLPFYQFTTTHAATRFEAKGLPPGMKFNSRTGELSGRPNKPGDYTLRIRARNAAGVSAWHEYRLSVDPLPDGVAGTFRGLLEASEAVNQSLGGAIEIKITLTGAFTGKVWLPGGTHAFRGRLEATPGELTPEIALTILRRKPPSLELAIQAESAGRRCVGTLSVEAQSAAWRAEMDHWHKRNQPADSRAGYHTTLMKHAGSPATGAGFASVKVDLGGGVRVVGRTADALALTQSRKLSRTGEVPVFALLDKKRASLRGWLAVNEGTTPDFGDGTVTGALDWKRLGGLTGTRFHPEGFDLALDVQGGRHQRPDAGQVLMALPDPSLTPDGVNAKITFAGASVSTADMAAGLADLGFSLSAKHKAVFPAAGSPENPARVKLSVNAGSGVVKGTFDLRDADPAGGSKPLRRLVTFHGMISGNGAEGCFLLPDLPAPPQKLKDTPLQSGAFIIEAK